jgi:predicted secreted protein
LFLFVTSFTLAIHVVYSFLFRDVIGLAELHDAIREFPPSRQVRGVGHGDLDAWRIGNGVVTLIEIALVPFLAKGAARVVEQDERGEVPTVGAALTATMKRGYRWFPSPREAGPLLVTIAVALVTWWLVRRTGLLLVEPVGRDSAWAANALVEGVARGAAAPFVLVSVVLRKSAPKEEKVFTPNL